jgi:hypothetical protein
MPACEVAFAADGQTISDPTVVEPIVIYPPVPPLPATSNTTTLTADYDPTQFGHPVTFTATVTSDGGTGIPTGTVQWTLDGDPMGGPITLPPSGVVTWSTSSLPIGLHTLSIAYSGDATHDPSASPIINHTVKKRLATTATVSSPGFVYGQAWTLTAQIIPENVSNGQYQPTGTLEVLDKGTPLSTGTAPVKLHLPNDTLTTADFTITIHCPIASGPMLSCTITITWTASGARNAGNHNVRVVYSGDATNYTGSTSPVDVQKVSKATPSCTVTSAPPSPIAYGTKPTFTATCVNPLAPIGSLAPANVQFLIDGTLMGPLVAMTVTPTGGTATFTPTWNLPTGKHTIRAHYLGNTNFVAVQSAGYTLVINP